ncbi:hypothetical protein B484DRAFT_434729 [Ochromonadaceae sp. CCMP2298]|nr:hypothetical protein B484DRAFT_434729 [Ochromonadaceae sp. CCMP2298]
MSLEALVAHMQSVFQHVDTKVKGTVASETVSDEGSSLRIDVIEGYPPTCPKTFQAFVEAQKTSMSTSRLAQWYTRYKLYWSCSSLCCNFVRYLVPELERIGVSQLCSSAGTLLLRDLAVYNIVYAALRAPATHTITSVYPKHPTCGVSLPDREDIIECSRNGISVHNILVCTASGVVVDLSGGQFTGSMEQPCAYPDLAAYFASGTLPGKKLEVRRWGGEVNDQVRRDVDMGSAFATRVAASYTNGWAGLCRECHGVPERLLKCGRCGEVTYCGKLCQERHWRREHCAWHKQEGKKA